MQAASPEFQAAEAEVQQLQQQLMTQQAELGAKRANVQVMFLASLRLHLCQKLKVTLPFVQFGQSCERSSM